MKEFFGYNFQCPPNTMPEITKEGHRKIDIIYKAVQEALDPLVDYHDDLDQAKETALDIVEAWYQAQVDIYEKR